MNKIILPSKEERELQRKQKNERIKKLYELGYSLQEICLSENISRTAAFFAIKGRPTQKSKTKPNKQKQ